MTCQYYLHLQSTPLTFTHFTSHQHSHFFPPIYPYLEVISTFPSPTPTAFVPHPPYLLTLWPTLHIPLHYPINILSTCSLKSLSTHPVNIPYLFVISEDHVNVSVRERRKDAVNWVRLCKVRLGLGPGLK